MTAYPVTYEADYDEDRSRLTVFFRMLLAIPHVLALYVVGLGVAVAVVIAWFAVVVTGRYPEGLYRFNAHALQWVARVNAYLYLQTDAYPPFGFGDHPEYPVRVAVAAPQAQYSRVKAFFRLLLAIPVMIIQYALALVAGACALVAWVVIVITGRLPKGIHDGLDLGLAYTTKASAYLLLLTETWPPFSGNGDGALFPASSSASITPGGPVSPAGWAPPAPGQATVERPGGLEG